MSIVQFLRMLWARRILVLVAMICSLLGAYVVILIAQPRYEAKARVMVNLLRPDPVTGESINARTISTYMATQIEVLKDYAVTGSVVDAFGWLTDPGLIQQYAARPKTDTRDFRRWLAQKVADRTTATLVGGQFLEITYSSGSPVAARVGAEALRQSYLDASLELRRRDAARMGNWYNAQAETARKAAETAENAKAAFERESGIVMQSDLSDLDSDRLRSLANQLAVTTVAPVATSAESPARLQLAQLDAQIAEISKSLGPNHPQMIAARAKRDMLAKLADQQDAAMKSGANATAANVGAVDRALQAQKSIVIAQRDKVERLRQLQAEVDLRREQYRKTAARAAELNLEAAAADTGMTAFGVVVAPTTPAFPNKPLILGGSLALGLGMGLSLALLVELLSRRVRGIEDLEGALDVPCLAVVASAGPRKKFSLLAALGWPDGLTPRTA